MSTGAPASPGRVRSVRRVLSAHPWRTMAGCAALALVAATAWIGTGVKPQVPRDITPAPRAVAAVEPAQTPARDFTAIAGWHLFGQADGAAAGDPAAAGDAPVRPDQTVPDGPLPVSQIPLSLTGVVYSPNGEARYAILAHARSGDRSYAIGDRLPGDAELRRIEPRRIVVRRDGRFEEIPLPRLGEPQSGTAPREAPPASPGTRLRRPAAAPLAAAPAS